MNAAGDRTPKRPERVAWVDVDGEVVAWDPLGQHVHHLDVLTSAIWSVLDGDATVSTLADDLAEASGRARAEALDHLRTVLDALDEIGLVEWAESPG